MPFHCLPSPCHQVMRTGGRVPQRVVAAVVPELELEGLAAQSLAKHLQQGRQWGAAGAARYEQQVQRVAGACNAQYTASALSNL